ncbi:PKD domain-containing protein [Methanosarcina sp.]|uniref:PKD domain-containing protein n=1 Tax=Methanosarcina sp. TaxID=2213 RepID=UPI003C78555B
MKRIAIFFVVALLVLMPFSAMASAPQVSCKGGTCSNLKITKVTINPTSKTAPAKVGFTSYISGPVKLVQYTVIDSKTGKVVGSSSSYCSKCTKKGICTCSYIIKEPGTYNVKVTAYGSGNCCVSLVKKAVITIAPGKTPSEFVPGFKSVISGKKVTFKDTTSGAKPIKWNWNFGDGYRSTAQNPTHTYKKAGTYTVCLTVYNSNNNYKLVYNRIAVK